MKLKIAILILFMNIIAILNVAPETKGVVEDVSFDVFRSQYGDMFNVSYWQNQNDGKYYFHNGLYDDFINFAWAANLFGAYWGVGYDARIMDHGSWPNQLTDMDVCVMLGIPKLNLGIKISYFDKNVYKGIGTAAPKIEIAKSYDVIPLAVGFECEGKFRYWKGMKLDVVQVPFIFRIDFSRDGMRGAGFSGVLMPTFEAPHGVNDVSETDPMYGFTAWAGWCWKILENVHFGVHPNFMMNVNCINTTEYDVNTRLLFFYEKGLRQKIENLNWIPENGNVEWRVSVPVSVIYDIKKNLSFIAGFKCGFYWANFDHLSEEHEGGCNLKGIVNETGFALGLKVEMNEHMLFQIGSSYIRQVSLETDDNETGEKTDYKVNKEKISFYNLFKSPLTASLTLKF